MIEGVVFSRNRSLQLDSLLRSIRENFKEISKITVLYEYDDYHQAGIERIIKKEYGLNISFIRKIDATFKNILLDIFNNSNDDYITCFCDDDIVMNSKPIDKDVLSILDEGVLSLSLRLGKNIKIRYATDEEVQQPIFSEYKEKCIIWEWDKAPFDSDWNWPLTISGAIYKKDFLYSLINNLNFKSPNTLEGAMNSKKKLFINLKSSSLFYSKIINNSVNRVQTDWNNRFGRLVSYTVEELHDAFMSDKIIDNHSFYNKDYDCIFVEKEITLK